MNTVGNTRALLDAMALVGMVVFPSEFNATSFYYDRAPVLDARISPHARFTLWFPGMDANEIVGVNLSMNGLFRRTMAGLVQMAVQSNLAATASFQSAKFPVLLGSSVLAGKVA